MNVSKHAEKRLRQRLGLPKKACVRHAERALLEGIKHKELSGRAHRYFDSLYFQKETANNLRVYGDFIYIFNGDTLITVHLIPERLRGVFRRQKA